MHDWAGLLAFCKAFVSAVQHLDVACWGHFAGTHISHVMVCRVGWRVSSRTFQQRAMQKPQSCRSSASLWDLFCLKNNAYISPTCTVPFCILYNVNSAIFIQHHLGFLSTSMAQYCVRYTNQITIGTGCHSLIEFKVLTGLHTQCLIPF